MGKKKIRVPFEISKRSLQQDGFGLFRAYKEIATMELVRALQPKVKPIPSEGNTHSHKFEVEIEIDTKYLKKEYR